MKIWLVRHGEAMDDIRNEYGGWHDPELSDKGVVQATEMAIKLKTAEVEVTKILSSPLIRALQTAEPIAKELGGLKVEKCVYLKERNTYGLLCGVNKVEALKKYPELVAAYDEGREVWGYEDYGFFVKRVRELVKYFGKINQNIIAVTHSKLLNALLTEVIGKKASKLNDGCLVEVELTEGKMTLVKTEGVEF